MGALYKGLIATGVLSLVGIALVIYWLVGFGMPLDRRRRGLHRPRRCSGAASSASPSPA